MTTQLVTVRPIGADDGTFAAAWVAERGIVALASLPEPIPGDAFSVLGTITPAAFVERVAAAPAGAFRPVAEYEFVAPYGRPHKIWGIGLNYRAHADDLGAPYPDEPASFLKADHTVIGPGEAIVLPEQSRRVTAEAELGLVFGRLARNVSEAEAVSFLWGVCPVLDQTAEDILQRNPRFLTVSKNFPTFFSFGPGIVPITEVLDRFGDLGRIKVETIKNGEVHRANTVDNMIFSPELLISFHSRVMPLFPGDILSSGTPGATVVAAGDVATCRIDGIGELVNPVR